MKETIPWIICAVLVGILAFGWHTYKVRTKDYAIALGTMDRAVQVGLVKVNPETGDTVYSHTALKYVLTGKSRLYGN